MNQTYYEKLADLEMRIAECEAHLKGNRETRMKDSDWEARCRFTMRALQAKRDALLKVIERAEAHVCSC